MSSREKEFTTVCWEQQEKIIHHCMTFVCCNDNQWESMACRQKYPAGKKNSPLHVRCNDNQWETKQQKITYQIYSTNHIYLKMHAQVHNHASNHWSFVFLLNMYFCHSYILLTIAWEWKKIHIGTYLYPKSQKKYSPTQSIDMHPTFVGLLLLTLHAIEHYWHTIQKNILSSFQ